MATKKDGDEGEGKKGGSVIEGQSKKINALVEELKTLEEKVGGDIARASLGRAIDHLIAAAAEVDRAVGQDQ